ncbi:MAG: phosphodiesterase [Firmicutes bacterium]|nr:phosphodiesterase [Bacillota bacterium]
MKIFIATDIHGSARRADELLHKFGESGADTLVLLGDLYNHGPRNPFPDEYAPSLVAEKFNGISDKIIAVKGNCDSEVDEMISEFPIIEEEILLWGGRRLFFTHGHLCNKDNLPCGIKRGDVLFYGHFHVNGITERNGVICVNVGSASLPKDGKRSYCIVDDNAVTLYDLDGNVIETKRFDKSTY